MTGLVREVGERGAQVSFGSYAATVTAERDADRRPSAIGSIFKRGDLAPFRIRSIDAARKRVEVTFEPQPDVQAALRTCSMSRSRHRSRPSSVVTILAITKFNHATQANRQTGSVFKPFIYAAAIEQGCESTTTSTMFPFQRGEWIPHNYDNGYMGPISIRQALALSRNIPAVRILDEIGVSNAANLVTRLKLPNPMAPFLPSALGATEEPLLSMAAAYAVFANRGHLVRTSANRPRRRSGRKHS
jgi:penicillin-binding protein 1A